MISSAEPPMLSPWKPSNGERLYAIGDIHGCVHLFEDLLSRIREDSAARPPATTRVIVLGDVIDRGPASSEMVQRLMRYTHASRRFTVLKGNHEQIMVSALSGDYPSLEAWLRFGGDATLASWGVPDSVIAAGAGLNLLQASRARIPQPVIDWLDRLKLVHRSGDVVFVHAGVRPGVNLARQLPADLMWIADPFLESDEHRPFLVVHGHTIVETGPDIRSNRIGIDTGAYYTGRLTALGLEANEIWTLTT